MKSKKQKQLEALQRRRHNLSHWDMRLGGFKTQEEQLVLTRKRAICLMDIHNLEKKLGFAAAEAILS